MDMWIAGFVMGGFLGMVVMIVIGIADKMRNGSHG